MKHVFKFKNKPFFMLTDKLKTEIMCYTTGERIPVCSHTCRDRQPHGGFFGDAMSMDKAIEHGKEWRKPFTKSKAIDHSCRNHGNCSWCKGNRLHKFRDRKPREKE